MSEFRQCTKQTSENISFLNCVVQYLCIETVLNMTSVCFKYDVSIQHFNNQLKHTTLKKVELLKYFKISKTVPKCFGLQGNHHQGATIST